MYQAFGGGCAVWESLYRLREFVSLGEDGP